jgi:hypothetical protein
MYGSDASTSGSTQDSPFDLKNIGVSTSVGSSAMTINLLGKNLAAPSGSNPVNISFRDSTSATGDYVVRTVSGATSITIPSSATLGGQSNFLQYIYLVAIDNSGTVELGVIGSRFDLDDGSIQSSTTISSSATDWNTIYSTTGRTSKAIRILARIGYTQSSAGTWATNSSQISLYQGNKWPEGSSYLSYTPTFTGFGTPSGVSAWARRDKDCLYFKAQFTPGSVTGVQALMSLDTANSLTIDGNKMGSSTEQVGAFTLASASAYYGTILIQANVVGVNFGLQGSGNAGLTADLASNLFGGSRYSFFGGPIPIKQWRSY